MPGLKDSFSGILDSIMQSTQTAQQSRQSAQPRPSPQAPAMTEFDGLVRGLINTTNQKREAAMQTEEAARTQAVAVLQSIPDTPENRPIKLQLLTSILHPKSEKSWRQIFDPQADHQAGAKMLERIMQHVPTQREVQQQQGEIPAERPRVVPMGADGQLAEGYVPTSQKFQFPDDGKYGGMQLVNDPVRGLIAVMPNTKTGKPEMTVLGDVQSEKMVVAGIRNEGKAKAPASDATIRREMATARALAADDDIDLDTLSKDDPTYKGYILSARKHFAAKEAAQLESTQATVPLKKAQAALANQTISNNGKTNAMVVAENNRQQDKSAEFKGKYDSAVAESNGIQTEINAIWNLMKNAYPSLANNPKKLVAISKSNPDLRGSVIKLTELEGKLAESQTRAQAATEALRGFQSAPKAKLGKPVVPATGVGARTNSGRYRGGVNFDAVSGEMNAAQEQATVQQKAQQYLSQEYFIDDVPHSPNDAELVSAQRAYGDKNLFFFNPVKRGVDPATLRKGSLINTEKGQFVVLTVASHGGKALVVKVK